MAKKKKKNSGGSTHRNSSPKKTSQKKTSQKSLVYKGVSHYRPYAFDVKGIVNSTQSSLYIEDKRGTMVALVATVVGSGRVGLSPKRIEGGILLFWAHEANLAIRTKKLDEYISMTRKYEFKFLGTFIGPEPIWVDCIAFDEAKKRSIV